MNLRAKLNAHRRALTGVAVVSAAVAIVAIGISNSGGDVQGGGLAASGTALATVERGKLTSQLYEDGTLGFEAQPDGTPYAVVNQATGLYTMLPQAGEVTKCGRVLYRVDDNPVLLLCGSIPAYRHLYEGDEGPDVRILNRNLVQLRYASEEEIDPDSDEFGPATASALEQLQDDLGIEESGSLELGEAAVLPGPLRTTNASVSLGTAALPGAVVAEATSTRPRVEVGLEAAEGSEVEIGDHARVTLPDGSTTPGAVSQIGAVASDPEGGESEASAEADPSEATIPVQIRLEDPRRVGDLERAPVQVQITTGEVKEALSVPVTALVAQAGGGYAVEVNSSDGRHLIEVQLGVSDQASGLVEVRGNGLAAGDRVVVPAS